MNENTLNQPTVAEAREALASVEQTIVQTRRRIAQGMAAPMLIVWGLIWMVGFACTEFIPRRAFAIWMVLDAAGMIWTMWIVMASRQRLIKQPRNWRIGAAWLTLMGYMVMWGLMLPPGAIETAAASNRLSAYIVSAFMCAYVVMGWWFGRFLVGLGLGVTALTVAGLYAWPEHFNLWVALSCGGALAGTGVYIQTKWK